MGIFPLQSGRFLGKGWLLDEFWANYLVYDLLSRNQEIIIFSISELTRSTETWLWWSQGIPCIMTISCHNSHICFITAKVNSDLSHCSRIFSVTSRRNMSKSWKETTMNVSMSEVTIYRIHKFKILILLAHEARMVSTVHWLRIDNINTRPWNKVLC